jgi:pSer/pThr/pTyr-binding forkhead associated (FHA) protein
MADPRLNSIHLEMPRRQVFREAREALLGARGMQTIAAEKLPALNASIQQHNTFIQNVDPHAAPPGLKYMLMDRDYIYPLKVGLNTIGRLPDNDVVVNDAHVSRRHCAILIHVGDNCELHDVASKNGTFVNGRRLSGPTPLHSGDEIRMCDRPLIFMAKSDQPRSGASPTATQSA